MDELIRMMCVDTNELVREVMERKFNAAAGFAWCCGVADATNIVARARDCRADVILLDLDLLDADPFDSLTRLTREWPSARVLVLSGNVTPGLVDGAMRAGASGFLSKADQSRDMVKVAMRVARGNVTIGPEVQAICGPLAAARSGDSPAPGRALRRVAARLPGADEPAVWSRLWNMFRRGRPVS